MAKFKVSDKVKHLAAPDGSYPAGEGTIETVTPGSPASAPATYTVRCAATGQVLPTAFKENELALVK